MKKVKEIAENDKIKKISMFKFAGSDIDMERKVILLSIGITDSEINLHIPYEPKYGK